MCNIFQDNGDNFQVIHEKQRFLFVSQDNETSKYSKTLYVSNNFTLYWRIPINNEAQRSV